jgi:hypothetical protein
VETKVETMVEFEKFMDFSWLVLDSGCHANRRSIKLPGRLICWQNNQMRSRFLVLFVSLIGAISLFGSVLFTPVAARAQTSNSVGSDEELTDLLKSLYTRDPNDLPQYNDYRQCVGQKLNDEGEPPPEIAAQMTPVSPHEAAILFQEFKNSPTIPFRYAEDGCYARTFQMHRISEKKGIKMGSIYIEGDFDVKTPKSISPSAHWQYHVAPVIPVYTDAGIVMMVIDPSLFDGPVPVEDWRDEIADEDSESPYCLFYSNRFSVEPDDLPSQEITFRNKKNTEDELARIKEILNDYDEQIISQADDVSADEPLWVKGVVMHELVRGDRFEFEIGEHDGIYYMDRNGPHYFEMLKTLNLRRHQALLFQVNPLSLEILSVEVPK